MKTIKELLEELPEPYRSKALANTKSYVLETIPAKQTVACALARAFSWTDSKEGFGYWIDYHDSIDIDATNW